MCVYVCVCLRLCWFRPKRISPDRESMQCRRNIERATRGKGALMPYGPLHPYPLTAAGKKVPRRRGAHETGQRGDREISVPEEEVLDSLVTDRVKDARARAGSGSQMGPNGAGPAPEYLDWSWAGTMCMVERRERRE